MAPSDSDKLELATFDALRGCDDLVKRLSLEMSTGVPAISDLAYAVKVRIKHDYKIVDKVLRKRSDKENPRPDYSVTHIRDIVGLRIVTLYRLDALKIIPALLAKIQMGTEGENALFTAEPIEEIIIYSTNPTGDAQGLPKRLRALFESSGYGDITKINQTPSNYSSTHMVVWGRGKYNNDYRNIPIEIQIRTAFEDVWGEIDHSMKYKRDALSTTDVAQHELERLTAGLSNLNVLKTLVDGIAQYADQIKLQLDDVGAKRPRLGQTRVGESPSDQLERLAALPGDLKQKLEHIIQSVPALVAKAAPSPEGTQRTQAIRAQIDALEAILEELAMLELDEASKDHAGHVARMNLGLLRFELGKQVGAGSSDLLAAVDVYKSVLESRPDDLIARYRYARVFDALSDRATAIAQARDAMTRLEANDSLLPSSSWIRCALYRFLGALLWEEAISLSSAQHDPGTNAAQKLHLRAYDVTRKSYDTAMSGQIPEDAAKEERARSANNLAYYALEYIKAGGEKAELETRGFTPERLRGFLSEFGADAIEELTDAAMVNTAQEAFEWLGERDLAARAAKHAKSLLSRTGTLTSLERQTLEAAEALLDQK